jgi:hypothetical protein
MKVLLMDNLKFTVVHSRLGAKFLLKLNDHCDLTIYGSGSKVVNTYLGNEAKNYNLVPHNKEFTVDEMLQECGKPDVILMHQQVAARSLKPKGFDRCKIPKAIMYFDTYVHDEHHGNVVKSNFVKEQNINLVIRRGCRSFYDSDIWTVPSVWLPFSVREENYYTDLSTRYLYGRRNMITFVGSGHESKNTLYKALKKGVGILKGEGLMAYQGIVGVDAYPNALKSYVAALSYTFEWYKGHPAKLFELMGSGTGVLTQSFSNKKELFGEDEVCWEVENDCFNLVEQAKRVLDPKERKDLYYRTRNALNVINTRHLDKHRIIELIDILKALAGGSQIPSIWE